MRDQWLCVVKVMVCVVLEIQADEEPQGYIGETPPDPVKEMLARFDKSPWTVFAIETSTSRIEREMREYMEQHANMEDLEREMHIHGVVPDHLEYPPQHLLELHHFNREHNYSQQLHLAEIYTPTLTLELPKLKYKVKPDTSYIHMLLDPDHICSRYEPEIDSSEEDLWPTTLYDGKIKAFIHYLRVNIPHDNITLGGDTIVEYLPPHPPNGTGLHRYLWLVYEQPHQHINFTEKRIIPTTAYERDWFHLPTFTKQYNLSTPISGIFYYSKFDHSVPYIYAKLDDVLI